MVKVWKRETAALNLCQYLSLPSVWKNILPQSATYKIFFGKNSFEPDLNQRPMDYWQCTTTVHRSTNWAIEGDIVCGELWKVMLLIGLHNCPWELVYTHLSTWHCFTVSHITGGVAQMVERSLSMREVPGSIPGASTVLPSFPNIFNLAKKHCIVRESNPGRPRGRRAFYHWTNDATLSKLYHNTTQQNFAKCHRLKIFRGR